MTLNIKVIYSENHTDHIKTCVSKMHTFGNVEKALSLTRSTRSLDKSVADVFCTLMSDEREP